MGQLFENVHTFWNWLKILRIGQHFENGLTCWKWVSWSTFLNWVNILKICQHLENGSKFWKWVKWAKFWKFRSASNVLQVWYLQNFASYNVWFVFFYIAPFSNFYANIIVWHEKQDWICFNAQIYLPPKYFPGNTRVWKWYKKSAKGGGGWAPDSVKRFLTPSLSDSGSSWTPRRSQPFSR